MPEICYTPRQIKIIRALILAMTGFSLFQVVVIKRLLKDLTIGQRQFDKLHKSANYLLEIINNNDIELTEFDFIAISAINDE